MAKRESEKKWQKNNPDKLRDYQHNYLVDKKVVKLVMSAELASAIERVKPKDRSWAGWIMEVLAEKVADSIPSHGK